MTSRCVLTLLLAAALAGCDGQLAQGTTTTKGDGSSRVGLDAGFVCTPPAAASEPGFTFSGTLFDSTGGCLSGSPITLPACGCFQHWGHDTSTWCFASPDGTAYFATSPDECDVQIPPGWYATQRMGPSPSGTPNAAQAAACSGIAQTSTVKATYDRLGPPACTTGSGGG
jgi:hypothetical protein